MLRYSAVRVCYSAVGVRCSAAVGAPSASPARQQWDNHYYYYYYYYEERLACNCNALSSRGSASPARPSSRGDG